MIEYSLVRSRRKTMAIHILKDARVEVRAPMKTPKSVLDKFVSSKAGWIEENVEKRRRTLDERAAFSLGYGSGVPLLGGRYPIAAHKGRSVRFDGTSFLIPAGLAPEEIKEAVIIVYKELARNILREKTEYYSALMGVTPRTVRISGARTRWGSCSGVNGICFSWRLIMAEEETVNYVVVHELAHILEHNHSQRFWAIVEGIVPNYKEKRKQLKALHEQLSRENWQ